MAQAKNPDYVQTRAPQVKEGTELSAVVRWIDRELRALAAGQIDKTALELRTINVAPPQPREGMIVCADGTNWNPGSGKGIYAYLNGAWTLL